MIKEKGVYTTKCPKCTRTIVMHVSSDGSVSPGRCPDCLTEFAGVDYGKERNTFVVVIKAEKPKIVEEAPAQKDGAHKVKLTVKTDTKNPFSLAKKDKKESSFKLSGDGFYGFLKE